MEYKKPEIVAQNATQGSYAAGCPAQDTSWESDCKNCERTQ